MCWSLGGGDLLNEDERGRGEAVSSRFSRSERRVGIGGKAGSTRRWNVTWLRIQVPFLDFARSPMPGYSSFLRVWRTSDVQGRWKRAAYRSGIEPILVDRFSEWRSRLADGSCLSLPPTFQISNGLSEAWRGSRFNDLYYCSPIIHRPSRIGLDRALYYFFSPNILFRSHTCFIKFPKFF